MIVVEKRGRRAQDDVESAESHAALGDNHLRAQRRVAVHVVDVVGKRGVGVVDERAFQIDSVLANQLNIFMDSAIFESPCAFAK